MSSIFSRLVNLSGAFVTGVLAVANGGTGVTTSTGTTNVVLSNGPTLVAPILGAATATSVTFSPTTGGIVGTTTNDNASAGFVGEYKENIQASNLNYATAVANISSVDANASISGGTTTGETGITLTAGDWDIEASVFCSAVTAVGFTGFQAWIGTATGNSATGRDLVRNYTGSSSTTINDNVVITPLFRASISGSTTYYAKVAFTASSATTVNCRGGIHARRVR